MIEWRGEIAGTVLPAFEPVRQAFAANFMRTDIYRETGASLAVFHRGRLVVDLWGGATGGCEWTGQTLINVWSASKGLVAVAIGKLIGEGAIAYDDPVASVWPEFAAAGKGSITIAEVLSHRSGLNGFAAATTIADLYDWAGCCTKLATQAPVWPPGSMTSYHALTFGWLAGEIVRRVTGQSLGAYLQAAIAGPLGADVYIGLPEALEPRVGTLAPPLATPVIAEVTPVALLALINPIMDSDLANQREWRAAEIPAANGQASAMGLARLYAALAGGGSLDAVRIMQPEAVAGLTRRSLPYQTDALMNFSAWGMGMVCNPGGVYGPGKRAFGHSGWGGSFGCVDPDLDLAIGYVCGQMGSELTFDPRSVELANVAAACAAAI